MRNLKRLGAMALVVMLAAVLPALAKDATVGEFIMGLAKTKQVEATDIGSAVDSLARVGVRVPAGLNFSKSLTEADVSRISRLAGLNVTTTTPDQTFDSVQMDRFFVTFSGELGPGKGDDYQARNGETPDGSSGDAPGNGPPFDPYSKGKGGSKGKKKGHRSPTDPE